MNNQLHIVCFDVPSPPDYGGVIDVFYKIKHLHKAGIIIYLHLFQYGRKQSDELGKYCHSVYYYQRNRSLKKQFSTVPYIVFSRNNSDRLIKNIHSVEAPVLFEGLHTTFSLQRKLIFNRKIFVRTHNIEHKYYHELAKIESNFTKKLYYFIESIKLKRYEKTLKKADCVLAISEHETQYFKENINPESHYLPPFHPNSKVKQLSKKGYFALYHGNLAVKDNVEAAIFLIEVFKNIDFPLVIAGKSMEPKLQKKINDAINTTFIALKNQSHLEELMQRSHINILYSRQTTGVKLKLINALYHGRYILCNEAMVKDSVLERLCAIANSKTEFRSMINQLVQCDYAEDEIKKREQGLVEFNCRDNVQKITSLIRLGD